MRDDDPALEALRAAIESFAAERAPELFAQASAEATARVRNLLTEAIAQELIERTAELTAKPSSRPAAPRRTPSGETKRRTGPDRARTHARPPRPGHTTETAGSACWVYGVIAAKSAASLSASPGVDAGKPTRTVEHADLAAIVSDVSLTSFSEEALEENLNDVAWLETTARAHEHVLDDALAHATVVPMRLCTIYLGEDEIRSMLERERGGLTEALGRLEGKAEWGVKMIAAPGALSSAREAVHEEPGSGLSPGLAYIDAKRRAAQNEEDIDQLAEEWAGEVHERLAVVASEALLNPLQSPELGRYEGDMLLNGVYLVDEHTEEEFRNLASELAAAWQPRDVAIELTGPWPPYNFVKNSIEAAR
jgi:hypothetical protein